LYDVNEINDLTMKTKIAIILFLTVSLPGMAFNLFSSQEQKDPWTPQQLLNPAELAKMLNNPKLPQSYVFSVGPQAVIKGSIDIGPARMKGNLDNLRQQLDKLSKNALIVIYCGCCPFDRCPNVRPAIELLKNMQFRNYKLLNLPRNIKADWIDPGYPVND